jgi:hypothetical protein
MPGRPCTASCSGARSPDPRRSTRGIISHCLRATKSAGFAGAPHAGGGTRTPDTRIMIAPRPLTGDTTPEQTPSKPPDSTTRHSGGLSPAVERPVASPLPPGTSDLRGWLPPSAKWRRQSLARCSTRGTARGPSHPLNTGAGCLWVRVRPTGRAWTPQPSLTHPGSGTARRSCSSTPTSSPTRSRPPRCGPPAQRDDEWLDVAAAARHLCCPPSRIYDLKAAGRLRYAKEGTRLLFRRDWLDAALHIESEPRS